MGDHLESQTLYLAAQIGVSLVAFHLSILHCVWKNDTDVAHYNLDIPYILAYKPTIFGSILTITLWGSAYTRVMPHS